MAFSVATNRKGMGAWIMLMGVLQLAFGLMVSLDQVRMCTICLTLTTPKKGIHTTDELLQEMEDKFDAQLRQEWIENQREYAEEEGEDEIDEDSYNLRDHPIVKKMGRDPLPGPYREPIRRPDPRRPKPRREGR
jgi:hypothetical protein